VARSKVVSYLAQRGDDVNVDEAQRDVRSTFVGGSIGQLVSGLLWGVSAALATWGAPRQAITFLVVGGFFILPTT
jgi:hypothetical protein